MLRNTAALAGALMLAIAPAIATAQTTVSSSRSGHIDESANTVASRTGNANTFTGTELGTEFASYIEFAVPASTTPFTSVDLRLNTMGIYLGPNTLTVRDFNSSISDASVADLYADATTGVTFGSALATTSDTVLTIPLNPAGIAAVNAARGSTIAFGFTSGPNDGPRDGVFGASHTTTLRQMVLTPSPTPPAPPAPIPTMTEWAMIAFGAILAGGGALYLQRRRRLA